MADYYSWLFNIDLNCLHFLTYSVSSTGYTFVQGYAHTAWQI